MEVRAHIKFVRISPIKLRFLVDSLKKMSPQVALDHLGLSQLRTAKVFYKAIKSAVSNGSALPGFDPRKAHFKVLSVDEGPVLKRYRAGSRGMARPYVRKSSHITVVLEQAGIEQKARTKSQTPKVIESAVDTQAPLVDNVKPTTERSAKSAKPRTVGTKTVTNRQRTTNK